LDLCRTPNVLMKLTTLEKRRLRGDLIEVYKLLTGRETIDHTALLQLDDSCYGTRGHKFKLKKYRSRLDIRKHFFSNRDASHWNSLPSHVVDADTVLTSKKRLDACNEWGIQSWWSFLARHQQVTSNVTLSKLLYASPLAVATGMARLTDKTIRQYVLISYDMLFDPACMQCCSRWHLVASTCCQHGRQWHSVWLIIFSTFLHHMFYIYFSHTKQSNRPHLQSSTSSIFLLSNC